MTDKDYGPKTGASGDRPYNDDSPTKTPPQPPAGKDKSTPPDSHTEIDSEADIGDPAGR